MVENVNIISKMDKECEICKRSTKFTRAYENMSFRHLNPLLLKLKKKKISKQMKFLGIVC